MTGCKNGLFVAKMQKRPGNLIGTRSFLCLETNKRKK